MKKITADNLVCMNDKSAVSPFRIELAYARDDNLLFGEALYRQDAKLWLHRDLAQIVISAAQQAAAHNLRLVLYDGLRTVDAQQAMLNTQAVRENPHWLEEPRLLSPPGAGAHPRGMAIDCSLEHLDGTLLDMGTAFDFLAEDPKAAQNPAHRAHPVLSAAVKQNRAQLDQFMFDAAKAHYVALEGLAQEWWDFRLPRAVYERFEALQDADLPPAMRMVKP